MVDVKNRGPCGGLLHERAGFFINAEHTEMLGPLLLL